ncbi:5-amino-6-(D-ribitylamino)uracil--L-tyrosine 4-hydroxyphenyl transferase CofH [Haliangium ochraceum]|uniref:5-amino-6-(D-ribitylamino)uracil--L-tyrosine 4-hydroxyphenyl transferase n=1 Tax=Haliangium ochraceum (strain DSM 14365 / JCM 11303 / SMP-2) TaxID=502025 RepID=D0LGF4_HALO1|nr:5-amino-6-(D-ribitylamino)uracil--L-tyrosine 4-hydroxyphenyl transferase CofH [Haliangium ochraceum]ACY12700.1 7,8-didemethyl-8-hydroxy-5-deazariboflavin synthase, CofH subunit [Haliangium ochraceum DSM 14365]
MSEAPGGTPPAKSDNMTNSSSAESVRASELRAEAALARAPRAERAILAACMGDGCPSWQQAAELFAVRDAGLDALVAVADAVRQRQVGEAVSYVVNRNVNFTNVCVKKCQFCAFSRELRSEQGYYLARDQVIARVREAHALGATEVCLQAGLAPSAEGRQYIELCRAVKRAVPAIHVHGFSPEEVRYGALRAHMSVRAYLEELLDAGLGSMPGTSAEILDDELRARISPGRITTAQWIDVVTTAHALGIPTTSTIMYGHVEDAGHRARHLALLRDIQADTGGFTEFVPLSFIPTHAPMYALSTVPGVRPGPRPDDVVRMHAIARLMLGASVRNIQVSWVKEGMDMAARLLGCGGNDLGGTLINESISTAAGAGHGQRQSPRALRQCIRAAGRVPVQRDTGYRVLRRFGDAESDAESGADTLDAAGGDERFGSFEALIGDRRHRYRGIGAPGGD